MSTISLPGAARRTAGLARRHKVITAVTALFIAAIIGVSLATSGSPSPNYPAAASFSLPVLGDAGKQLSLSQYQGKPVIVNFWASWCGPCRQSFPWLSAMSERYGKDGLVVVAINLDKDRDAAQAFLRELSPPFTVAFDPAGKSAEAFDVKAMPSSFLVSRTGRLVASHAGFVLRDADAFEQQIKEEVGK